MHKTALVSVFGVGAVVDCFRVVYLEQSYTTEN